MRRFNHLFFDRGFAKFIGLSGRLLLRTLSYNGVPQVDFFVRIGKEVSVLRSTIMLAMFIFSGAATAADAPRDLCKVKNGRFLWLATDPRVPLAVSNDRDIFNAEPCCEAWSGLHKSWTIVDRFGNPKGQVAIGGGEFYDVTGCYELIPEEKKPIADGNLLVLSGGSPWTAPKSSVWTPSAKQKKSLVNAANQLETLFAAQGERSSGSKSKKKPKLDLAFFSMLGDKNHNFISTQFAVAAGRTLAIFGLDELGQWRIHYFDGTWGLGGDSPEGGIYSIKGVFDMDRDGFPEVIIHRNEGISWDDIVLKCSETSTLRPWRVIATSPGGSTA